MNAFYYTFGCKVNQYETENIMQLMEQQGYRTVTDLADVDVLVVNSCTVTENSDSKCRQYLKRARKNNPNCVIVLTGCFPQAFQKKAESISECDIITGTTDKTQIPKLINDFLENRQRLVEIHKHELHEKFESMENISARDKTRAFVKIQDGCDQYCTYCIIPYARGHIRSKPLLMIKNEIERLCSAGHSEIVLTGINLCCYGKDLHDGTGLVDAVETACSVGGVERVRLGSIEPEMISDEDIKRMASQTKLCPQFHLSLQSGCDKTLKAMNRHYNTAEFMTLANKLRSAFDECAITTDIMVGFAGETEEDFKQSCEFVHKIAFARAHIFPYSVREGTAAAEFDEQLDQNTKQNRARQMEKLCAEDKKAFLADMVGKIETVVFEKEKSPLWHQGYTANYTPIRVSRKNDTSLRWKSLLVRIVSSDGDYCYGDLLE